MTTCSRRRSSALAAALALLLSLALAPAAGAVSITTFRTPSENINCAFLGPAHAALRCDISMTDNAPKPKPASCEFEYGYSYGLTPRGKARRLCVSDAVVDPNSKVLRYGSSIRRYGMRCTSRRSGLRCVNRRGHGFRISRASQRLF